MIAFKNLKKLMYCFTSLFSMLLLLASGCRKIDERLSMPGYQNSLLAGSTKPNIIFILEDDIGYEIPQFTGGESYSTPEMNMMAGIGMQFTHCYASAMCSPSRITFLTGKYGFRNYHIWGVLDTTQKTIANMLHDHGYATCVSGKWQLDGGDVSIHKFGFDKYSVFDPFDEPPRSNDSIENKYRYKNPKIYQDGGYLPDSATAGKYSDDMFADYASKFIVKNKSKPFFVYFSFSECHAPFSPPPDNPDYLWWNPLINHTNIKYFPSMVSYMDGKIATLLNTVTQQGLLNKTYFFIVGDNGSETPVKSKFNGRIITGGKSTTNEFGLHVSLIVTGPAVQAASVNRNIIDFSDFMPTIANIAAIPKVDWSNYGIMDGRSFYPQLSNANTAGRNWSYGYYFPNANAKWQKRVYAQDTAYKLYDSTNHNYFFDLQKDSSEKYPIPDNQLTTEQKREKNKFTRVMAAMHN